MKKDFYRWHITKKAIECLNNLSKQYSIPISELLFVGKPSTPTWGHPKLAIEMTRQFSVDMSMYLNDQLYEAKFGHTALPSSSDTKMIEDFSAKDAELEDTKNKLEEVSTTLAKLQKNHNAILRRRTYPPISDSGKCFYVWYNTKEIDEAYKFGITQDIDDRMKTVRTTVRAPKLVFLVKTDKNDELEKYLDSPNHEFLVCSILTIVKYTQIFFWVHYDVGYNIEILDTSGTFIEKAPGVIPDFSLQNKDDLLENNWIEDTDDTI